MEFSRWENFFVVLIMMAILTPGIFFVLHNKDNFINQATISKNKKDVLTASISSNIILPSQLPQKLSNPPKIIKAVYVTGYSAGSKAYLDYLNNLFKNTEINAVVINIKGSEGFVSYDSGVEDVKKFNLYNGAIRDIDALVKSLHDQNIYVIGRIAVFEDPYYSKARPELAVYDKSKTVNLSSPVLWQDNHGLSWLDPASKDVWDYNISLAKDALDNHGFDEINFDYVRFPTDGKTGDIGFPIYDGKTEKSKIIKEFFDYTRKNLANEKISVDLFGLTTVNKDDMGIGQVLEGAFENFDYISPMVYPSHYASGFIGFANSAEHPYDVIKYSMSSALNRETAYENFLNNISSAGNTPEQKPKISQDSLAKFRPWLQDFNMGADYNADMIKAEIKATQDALGNDYNGFMLWNPSNKYTMGAISK